MAEKDNLNDKNDGGRKKRNVPKRKQILGRNSDASSIVEISGLIHLSRQCLIGTFLEGLFDLEPKDYLDSWEKLRPQEVKIGVMNDFERRLYTLLFHKYQLIAALAPTFRLDNNNLNNVIVNYSEQLIERLEKSVLDIYEQEEQEFSWVLWSEFIDNLDRYAMLSYLLDSLVYTRLMPAYYCDKPRYRSGFIIAKDVLAVMEEDSPLEDEKKISGQDYFQN